MANGTEGKAVTINIIVLLVCASVQPEEQLLRNVELNHTYDNAFSCPSF
jgi:hypothetical protein